MQKVEGSSPFIRSHESPAIAGLFAFPGFDRESSMVPGGPARRTKSRWSAIGFAEPSGARRSVSSLVKTLQEIVYEAGARRTRRSRSTGRRHAPTHRDAVGGACAGRFLPRRDDDPRDRARRMGMGCRDPARTGACGRSDPARALEAEVRRRRAPVARAALHAGGFRGRGRHARLVAAGYGYQALREENTTRVRWMSRISAALGVLMVLQTLAWLTGLAVD